MEDQEAQDGFLTLDKNNSHYISQVLRMKEGEELIVVLGGGVEALCEVNELSKDSVMLKIKDTYTSVSEPAFRITLYQSVSKGERMELTIQKCVELGVTKIVPVFSSRCVVRPDEPKKQKSKTDRWQKIALEAARQSGRGIIPEVLPIVSWKNAVDMMEKLDVTALLYEEKGGCAFSDIDFSDVRSVGLVVGSEGGFDAEEVDMANSENVKRVWLGNRILRCETAPITALSILMFLTNNM
jgi:16S rRNA (uracil1498-N3)-methyltransferase